MTSIDSRFAVIGRESPACGIVGRLPRDGRLPPLSAERTGEQFLIEVQVEEALYPRNQDIELAKLDADPALVRGVLLPLPPLENVWFLREGELRRVNVEEVSEALSGVGMVAPESCPEAIDRACAPSFPRCPVFESKADVLLEENLDSAIAAVSTGDRVLAVSGGFAYAIDEHGATHLESGEHFLAITGDGNGGAFLVTSWLCLVHVDAELRLEPYACDQQGIDQRSASLDLGEDGSVWLMAGSELFVFRGGEKTRVRALPTGRWPRLAMLPGDEAIIHLDQTSAQWISAAGDRPFEGTDWDAMSSRFDRKTSLIEGKNTGSAIYRFDQRASMERGRITLELVHRTPLFNASAMYEGANDYVVGLADGHVTRVPDRGCEGPQVGRMPQAIAEFDRGLVVVADDVLDFNYFKEADTRAYVFTYDRPALDCPASSR